MDYKAKDLITEPTTHGITYITKEGSQWVKKGVKMIDEGFPVQVDIELNTECNLRCPQCFQSKTPFRKEHMKQDTFLHLIVEAAAEGAESIKLQYRGEPLLYPQFVGALFLAKSMGLYVHFNTNGIMLSDTIIEALIMLKVDKVIFSVDGCTPATYEAIRVGAKFETVRANIQKLYYKKEERDSIYPMIAVHAVKQDLNREEIELGIFERFWEVYAEEIAIMEQFDLMDATEDATELPNWHCGQLWQRLIVLVDGRVIPCCGGYDYDNRKAYSLGNIKDKTLKEIWEGELSIYLKLTHMKGLSHQITMCRKCRIRKNVVKKLEGSE